MMKRVLRVLNVEDSERDAALLVRHLTRAGYDLLSERVDTPAAMRAALQKQEWDVILSDYSMPRFTALEALSLLEETGLDIPFIIISGTIGEEVAVEAMLAGAQDYLMKDNLTRLVPTIERELTEAEHRRARRTAEDALRQNEDRYRDLVEHSHDLICTHDLEGRVLSVNETAARLLGYDRESLLGRNIRDALLLEYRSEFEDYIASLMKEGIARGLMAVKTRSGGRRVWEYTNTLRTEGVTEPIVRGMAHDVTEQRRAQKALETSEAELRALFSAMYDVILVLDTHGRYLKIAPTDPASLYKPRDDLIGKTLHEVFSAEQADFFLGHIQRALEDGRMHRVEYSLEIDGSEVWFDGSVSPMSKDSVVWVARDITERKSAEQEKARLIAQIESQRQRLNNIIASVPGVVWEAWNEPDPATQRIDFVSDYVETMLGYTVEEWLETPNFWRSIVHPDDREQTERAVAASFVNAEPTSRLEFRWVAKDGRVLWVESQSAVITDDQGRAVGVRGVTIDVTERKQLEEQLRQSQKMEAVGRLAGGIAHDFNNLLTAIIGYSQLALARLHREDPMRKEIQEIEDAGQRAASLTSQLLAFSRRQVIQPQVLDLNAVVTKLSKMLQRVIGEDIELSLSLDEDIGRIKADPGQIEQIIMNLGVNSRDAMPQGGKLIIETRNVELDEFYTDEHLEANPGPHVMLVISDTGIGMNKETASHIFEPFFTTKAEGKGTGLGLSTVYGIVKQSLAHIGVYSESGLGTTFKIYFPRIDEAVGESKGDTVLTASYTASETILLVEDDGAVRTLARKILEASGYRVLETAGGDEPAAICKAHQGPIHLLLTDVIMPGSSGHEIAQRLRQLRPDLKVLYMSGYTDDSIIHHGMLARDALLLQKPFTRESLLNRVREVLDSAELTRQTAT